jgi:DNA-binding NtrC family response regulator
MSDRLTLLLADDDATITNRLMPFFERAGFHVLTAANGVEMGSATDNRFQGGGQVGVSVSTFDIPGAGAEFDGFAATVP